MLPQLGRLHLSDGSLNKVSKHSPSKRPHNKTTSPTFSSSSYTSPSSSPSSSSSCDVDLINQQSRYVIFKDKSTLFMPSAATSLPDPTYARIDDIFENDRSTDSGISDIYDSASQYVTSSSKCLTSDDVSLISRYGRVLRHRTKKSRFRRLSEFLCSGGNNSDEESEDSLYASLESSAPSSCGTRSDFMSVNSSRSPEEISRHDNEIEECLLPIVESPVPSSPDEMQMRFSKKDFFYNPTKDVTCHSEYVLAETPTLIHDELCATLQTPRKPQRSPPFASTPVTPLYENLRPRDFTKPRKKRSN